jgi:hypothetical protein
MADDIPKVQNAIQNICDDGGLNVYLTKGQLMNNTDLDLIVPAETSTIKIPIDCGNRN